MILRFVFWLRNKCDRYLERHAPDTYCPQHGPDCDRGSNRCFDCGRVERI